MLKTKKMKQLILIPLVLLLVFMTPLTEASAASSKKEKAVTMEITVWASQKDIDSGWIAERCKVFKKIHPKWKITFEIINVEAYNAYNKLSMNAPAGMGPDIYIYPHDYLKQLVKSELIAPYTGENSKSIKKNNSKNILNGVTLNGKVYGVPIEADTCLLYYNKKLYSKNDIQNLSTIIKKKPIAYQLSNPYYGGNFYLSNGCKINLGSKNKKEGFDFPDKKTAEVTSYLYDLVNNKEIINCSSSEEAASLLKNGTVGAYIGGNWDANYMKKVLGKNYAVAELPKININGKNKQMVSTMTVCAYGINPYSNAYTNKTTRKVIQEFSTFLGTPKSQLKHYTKTKVAPVTTKLANNKTIKKDTLATLSLKSTTTTSVLSCRAGIPSKAYYSSDGSCYGLNNLLYNLCYKSYTKEELIEQSQYIDTVLNQNLNN